MAARLVNVPAAPITVRGVPGNSTVENSASTCADASESCIAVGGRSGSLRSVRRTEPMSMLVEYSGSVMPYTNSVEPPPMSMTRNGGSPLLFAVAPLNASSASTSPEIISGVVPRIMPMASMSSRPFAASREADVATARVSPTSCIVIVSL